MAERYTHTTLWVVILLVLSACTSEATPIQSAPAPLTAVPTHIPSTNTPRPSATLSLPTSTVTPAPSATNTPNPAAGKPVTIQTIKMLDAQNGWAVGQITGNSGDSILFTHDGGLAWKDVGPAVPENQLAVAFFLNATTAWVIYYNQTSQTGAGVAPVIWRTADGGRTWQPSQNIALDSSVQMDFFVPGQIGFSDPQNGWLLVHLGAGMSHDYVAIFTSRDGGQTWQVVVDPNQDNLEMGCDKSGVTFLDANTAWAAGNCEGVVPILYFYRSGDAGHNWEQVNLPVPTGASDHLFQEDTEACGATSPVFLTDQVGNFIVQCYNGQNNQTSQWLYSSRNRGQSWSSLPLPAPFSGSVDFLDPNTAWMIGSTSNADVKGSKIYFTRDGGQNWAPLATVNWSGTPDFVDAQSGWIVAASAFSASTFSASTYSASGNSQNGSAPVLLKSGDGGKNWKILSPKIAP